MLDLRERLEDTLKIAQEELNQSQARYQRYYNRKAKDRKFTVKDKVLILLPTDNNKLLMQWKGPFQVEKVVGTNDCGIKIGNKVKTFHANMLKRFIDRETKVQREGEIKGECVLRVTGAAIIECSENEVEDAIDDDDLLELGTMEAKETAKDIVFGSQLSVEQKAQLEALVSAYKHIFTDLPGNTNIIEHELELTSEEPVRSKPYVVPYNVRESLIKDINAMLDMGVIRKSKSPYASPVVIVRKKDGTNRVCIEFRKLNRITLFETPISLIFL